MKCDVCVYGEIRMAPINRLFIDIRENIPISQKFLSGINLYKNGKIFREEFVPRIVVLCVMVTLKYEVTLITSLDRTKKI